MSYIYSYIVFIVLFGLCSYLCGNFGVCTETSVHQIYSTSGICKHQTLQDNFPTSMATLILLYAQNLEK